MTLIFSHLYQMMCVFTFFEIYIYGTKQDCLVRGARFKNIG